MLGFKAAKADVGQWVRGPNVEQKHSLPLVTCSQWAWSPLQGTHSAWAIQRDPGPQISHPACRGSSVWLSPISLSLSLPLFFSVCIFLPQWRPKNILRRGESGIYQSTYDRVWFSLMKTKQRLLTQSVWKDIFIHKVSDDGNQGRCPRRNAGRCFAVWTELTDHLQCEIVLTPSPLTPSFYRNITSLSEGLFNDGDSYMLFTCFSIQR